MLYLKLFLHLALVFLKVYIVDWNYDLDYVKDYYSPLLIYKLVNESFLANNLLLDLYFYTL